MWHSNCIINITFFLLYLNSLSLSLSLSLLFWNSTRTCKRRHPFACFDKWTASTVIPLPDLLQPPWFHSINFQSQRSLCSAAATVIAASSLAAYSYLHTHICARSIFFHIPFSWDSLVLVCKYLSPRRWQRCFLLISVNILEKIIHFEKLVTICYNKPTIHIK